MNFNHRGARDHHAFELTDLLRQAAGRHRRESFDGELEHGMFDEHAGFKIFHSVEAAHSQLRADVFGKLLGLRIKHGESAFLRTVDDPHPRENVEHPTHAVAGNVEPFGELHFRIHLAAFLRLMDQVVVNVAKEAFLVHEASRRNVGRSTSRLLTDR